MFSRLAPRVLSRVAASAKPSFSASPLARPTFAAVARPSTSFLARAYSEADERLTVKNVEIRILDIFRTFDKVNQDNLNLQASFTKDLGLDSLDAVEVIMAIEEEFFIEIPDAEADEIRTVQDAVNYIVNCPEAGA